MVTRVWPLAALAAIVAGAVAAGCVDQPDLGTSAAASTVDDHLTTTCTTAVVLELSRQVAREVECMAPGQLVAFSEGGGIDFTGAAVLPYVTAPARADLLAAVAAGGGRPLQITSAYRTVVQQYLLYRWFQLGRCGITAAAVPGNSNHESGRAIDVGNHDAWAATLPDVGWAQTVLPADPVHFDHLASADMRGADVLAFQRLWNRNRPGDVIDDDGLYGPMTAARIAAAPAEGFAIGPSCATGTYDVAVEAMTRPPRLAPGEAATVGLVLRNTGDLAWPAGTALVTAEPAGRASALADGSWPAPDRPAVLAAAVAPGAAADVTFDVVGPEPGGADELTESFALTAGATRFGAIALVIDVGDDPAGATSGGCSTGGRAGDGAVGGGAVALALLALAALPRRRRR